MPTAPTTPGGFSAAMGNLGGGPEALAELVEDRKLKEPVCRSSKAHLRPRTGPDQRDLMTRDTAKVLTYWATD